MTTAEDFSEFSDGPSWRRRAVALALVIAVIGGGAYAGWYYFVRDNSTTATAPTAQEATVSTGRLVSSFTATGVANAISSTKTTFGTTGTVKTVSVAIGDKVTAGQELARLDDKNASHSVETAASNLATAQLRLKALTDPPNGADLAAARASVGSAQAALDKAAQGPAATDVAAAEASVASAQAALDKATRGPAATDVAAADAALTSAQIALQNANNQVDTSWTALISAQRNYCVNGNTQTNACYLGDIPLSDEHIADLNAELRNPNGNSTANIISTVTAFLQASTSYKNAKSSILSAQKGLESAQAKRQALEDPPSASDLGQLQALVGVAQAKLDQLIAGPKDTDLAQLQASITVAQAKLDQLVAGPKDTDLALQQQSVKQAQISYQQALDATDALVLRAPFDGVVSAAVLNVGDSANADSATIINPDGMKVDLTVSETDLPSLKKGVYGLATFDALAGNSYIVKIIGITTTPTVTQGIVTYPVQAQILRAADLQKEAANLQTVAAGLLSLGGGRTGAAGAFPGGAGAGDQGAQGQANGTPRANRTPGANPSGAAGGNRTPGANRTPGTDASGTPGAGGTGNGGPGGGGAGGAGFLAAFANAPLPSPGMSASVIVLTDVKENVLLVPTGAIKRQGATRYVVVKKDDGTTENVNVTIGGADNTNSQILTGLTEGQKVVLGATTAATGATPGAGNGAGNFPGGGNPFGGGGNQPPGGVR